MRIGRIFDHVHVHTRIVLIFFSDAETTRLQQQWEEVSSQRDAIRDELRKTKDELTKEREVLEAEQKKLLAKLERAKKTKEGLETVMKGSEENHAQVGPVLTKSVIQHANDMNNWIPILESCREFKHKAVSVPTVDSVLKKDYDQQLEVLSNLVNGMFFLSFLSSPFIIFFTEN